ncbi:MAG: hypothetical protein OXL41_03970 [Nitrospinae bacterium]|nr:hypothetical protein [Nitrospinota bacterium]
MTWTASFADNRTEENLTHQVAGHDGEAERRSTMAFNPGSHKSTFDIKIAICAAMKTIIDRRTSVQDAYNNLDTENLGIAEMERAAYVDAMRCFEKALNQLEIAQMFAVKALHTRANAGLKD